VLCWHVEQAAAEHEVGDVQMKLKDGAADGGVSRMVEIFEY
jgi:hypothetical protein